MAEFSDAQQNLINDIAKRSRAQVEKICKAHKLKGKIANVSRVNLAIRLIKDGYTEGDDDDDDDDEQDNDQINNDNNHNHNHNHNRMQCIPFLIFTRYFLTALYIFHVILRPYIHIYIYIHVNA